MSVYGGPQGFGTGGTGMSGPMMGSPGPNEHETVGAYALGILDDAEATAFEAHLASCEWCAQQLDELAGMEPMLAALADLPGSGTPAHRRVAVREAQPAAGEQARRRGRRAPRAEAPPQLLHGGGRGRADHRRPVRRGGDERRRLRRRHEATARSPRARPRTAFDAMDDKVTATDPTTEVSATVGHRRRRTGAPTSSWSSRTSRARSSAP